jgi:hypothetical protein
MVSHAQQQRAFLVSLEMMVSYAADVTIRARAIINMPTWREAGAVGAP